MDGGDLAVGHQEHRAGGHLPAGGQGGWGGEGGGRGVGVPGGPGWVVAILPWATRSTAPGGTCRPASRSCWTNRAARALSVSASPYPCRDGRPVRVAGMASTRPSAVV